MTQQGRAAGALLPLPCTQGRATVSRVKCECEGEGGRDTIKPQVFSPALSLTLPLPPFLPSHLAPLRGGQAAVIVRSARPENSLRSGSRPVPPDDRSDKSAVSACRPPSPP